jgi:outer membrane protein assembly factor BamD
MISYKYLKFFFIIILLVSCTKEVEKKTIVLEKSMELQMIEAYEQGFKELKKGDALYAAQKFNEAEILFPQSDLAPKAAIMSAYAYYSQNYYGDAIAELNRFIRVYPNYKNLDYVEYLIGLSYYEQIVDEKKDLQPIINAKKTFSKVIKKYPNTDYGLDAKYKIDLIDDILAAKEMYLGRYYFDKKKWIAAIKRFRNVTDDYNTTIYVEEALHRLVELYYILGLETEAGKYANLLGYNYQSSEWYERTYIVFNNNYKEKKKNEEKKNNVLKKIKSLFEREG